MSEPATGRALNIAVTNLHAAAASILPDLKDYGFCRRGLKIGESGASTPVVYDAGGSAVLVENSPGIFTRINSSDFVELRQGYGDVEYVGQETVRVFTLVFGPLNIIKECINELRLKDALGTFILGGLNINADPDLEADTSIFAIRTAYRRALVDAVDAYRSEFTNEGGLPAQSFCVRIEWDLIYEINVNSCTAAIDC